MSIPLSACGRAKENSMPKITMLPVAFPIGIRKRALPLAQVYPTWIHISFLALFAKW